MEALQRSIEDTYPMRATVLLSEMKSDVQKFSRHVCWAGDNVDKYVDAPVLAKISVNEFVDAFLALHPNDQHIVMRALKGRYESGHLLRDLKDERPWIASVRDALTKRMPALSLISQYRLQKHIEWYVKAP
jgi:hypothetical protein